VPDIGYWNGRFSALNEICLSPDDRGFLFGDGVYEVVRAYRGTPAFWVDHFRRLLRSAAEIQLPLPFDEATFQRILLNGIRQSGYDEVKIYIQLTRGVAPRDHVFPSPCDPTIFFSFREIGQLPSDFSVQGVSVITVPDIRWGRCDIKSLNLLPNVMAKQRAKESGVFEALFVRDNQVMEGATSNVFVVCQGVISTPLMNHQVLAGVTQHYVIEMVKGLGKPMECRPISLQELMVADEVFLTGTTIEVLPVIAIDGCSVGQGRPGGMTQAIQRGFAGLVARQ